MKIYEVLDIETLNRKEYGLYKEVTTVSEEEMFESVYLYEVKIALNKIMNDKEIFKKELEKELFIECFAKGNSIKSIAKRFNLDKDEVKDMLDLKISMIQNKYKEELMKLYNI